MTATNKLNLDRLLGKCKNRIYFVGVELEGGWDKLPPGTKLIRDGSIHFEGDGPPQFSRIRLSAEQGLRYDTLIEINRERGFTPRESVEYETLYRAGMATPAGMIIPAHIGEIPSEPLDPKDYAKWMTTMFPHHVNNTCGMHVHMSFRSALTYQRLMVPEYQSTLLHYLEKWAKGMDLPKDHPLWDRLASKSEHCQDKFWPDQQARCTHKDYDKNKKGHRYTHVNYCWNQHSTLEVRTLPMFKEVDQAIKAVKEILSITNAFIVVDARREEKYKASLEAEDDHFNEEMIECV